MENDIPMFVTPEERDLIERNRAMKATGYPLHETKDGKGWYFWPMGRQPETPIVGATPREAAEAFLKVYLSRKENPSPFNDYVKPRPRQLDVAEVIAAVGSTIDDLRNAHLQYSHFINATPGAKEDELTQNYLRGFTDSLRILRRIAEGD